MAGAHSEGTVQVNSPQDKHSVWEIMAINYQVATSGAKLPPSLLEEASVKPSGFITAVECSPFFACPISYRVPCSAEQGPSVWPDRSSNCLAHVSYHSISQASHRQHTID